MARRAADCVRACERLARDRSVEQRPLTGAQWCTRRHGRRAARELKSDPQQRRKGARECAAQDVAQETDLEHAVASDALSSPNTITASIGVR